MAAVPPPNDSILSLLCERSKASQINERGRKVFMGYTDQATSNATNDELLVLGESLNQDSLPKKVRREYHRR